MTLRRGFGVCLLSGIAAIGCGSDSDGSSADPPVNGGQTGEETLGCQPVDRTRLAWSERSALGFSADELLNALGAERDARLTWEDGTSTPLELTLSRGEGDLELQQREWVDDGSGAEIASAASCPDVVAIPVSLGFTTGDGRFAERWSFTLLAESTARSTAVIPIDLDALEGSFQVTQVDPSQFDDVVAHAALTLAGGGWTGTLTGQALQSTGSGPDDSSSALFFDIASF